MSQVTIAQLFSNARNHLRNATASERLHIRMSPALFHLAQNMFVLIHNLCHRGGQHVFVVATPFALEVVAWPSSSVVDQKATQNGELWTSSSLRRPHYRGTKFFSLATSSKLLVVSWSAQVCFCRLALLHTTHPNHKHSPQNILQKRHQETREITRHHTRHLQEGHLRYRTPITENGPTITTIKVGIPRRVFFTEISPQPKKKLVKWDPCRKSTPASAATFTRAKSAPTTIAAKPRPAASAPAARVHPHVHSSGNSSFLHDTSWGCRQNAPRPLHAPCRWCF